MGLVERLPALIDDRDEAADVVHHLAEDSLVRLWASIQRFAEAVYGVHLGARDRADSRPIVLWTAKRLMASMLPKFPIAEYATQPR